LFSRLNDCLPGVSINIFINFIPLLVQHFHQFYPASSSTFSSIFSRFFFNILINFIPLLVQHLHQFYPASSSTFSSILLLGRLMLPRAAKCLRTGLSIVGERPVSPVQYSVKPSNALSNVF